MHISPLLLASAVLALTSALALPRDSSYVQRQTRYSINEERAAAVKEAFKFAWDGYHKYAFPHDELHPLSNGFSDSRYRCSAACKA